jgi:prevent-host-death family protein
LYFLPLPQGQRSLRPILAVPISSAHRPERHGVQWQVDVRVRRIGWPDSASRATSTHMKSVGIRALQQNAAAVLRRVRKGERLEVTDRGRRAAFLVPARTGDAIDRLEDSGALHRAEGDLLELGEPLRLGRRAETPSNRLARMRAGER